jgi:hypothetical protein
MTRPQYEDNGKPSCAGRQSRFERFVIDPDDSLGGEPLEKSAANHTLVCGQSPSGRSPAMGPSRRAQERERADATADARR